MVSHKSIRHAKDTIPQECLILLEQQLPATRFQEFINQFRIDRIESFRINNLSSQEFNLSEFTKWCELNHVKIKKVHYLPNVFQISAGVNELKKSIWFKNGMIYFQGLSGIIATYLLDPTPESNVLDIAAAPGSKTSLMAMLMENRGEITALEPDFIRCERLIHNLRALNVSNTTTHKLTGNAFLKKYEGKPFDFILADVPCSGEGRMKYNDGKSYFSWKRSEVDKLQRLQIQLLQASINHLRPSGVLCYSTCTLNKIENEEVLESILKNFPQIRCLPLPLHIQKLLKNTSTPQEWEIVDSGKVKALRIYPSKNFEGFFISLLFNTLSQ